MFKKIEIAIFIIIAVIILIIAFILKPNNKTYFEEEEDGKKIQYIEEIIPKKREKLYISIDFGNYKTSFAYNFGENIDNINIGKMEMPSVIILFKSNLTTKNYGRRSINSFVNYNDKEKNEIIFIWNIKQNLYPNKARTNFIKKNIFPKDYINKIEIETAISEYLKNFSDDALEEINSLPFLKNEKYYKNEVEWIVTVPGIWDDESKYIMINCAKKAGMNNINLALESESASLTLFNDNFINKELKQKDNIFMLIDLGGYVVDLTINEIVSDSGIINVLHSSGAPYGSININNKLEQIIESYLEKDIIEEVKNKQPEEYLQTLQDIEKVKKRFKGIEIGEFEIIAKFKKSKDPGFFTKITSPFINIKNYIYGFFKKEDNSDKNITKKEDIIRSDAYKIYIPGELLKKTIEENVNKTFNFVKKYIEQIKYRIDNIILVGGFSNCEILKNKFIESFKYKTVVSILGNPESSVTKGALIYLIEQNRIKTRVIQNTYGYIKGIKNDNNIKCENKIKCNKNYCNCVEYILNIGNKVENDIEKMFIPLSSNEEKMYINLYKTNEYKFNTSKNIDDFCFGTLILDLKEFNNTEVKPIVKFKFKSYLKFDVKDSITNKTMKFSFKMKHK